MEKAPEAPCPQCGAKPGQPCTAPPDLPPTKIHEGRFKGGRREDFSQAAARIVKEATENH